MQRLALCGAELHELVSAEIAAPIWMAEGRAATLDAVVATR
jgi:hypothetical protein